MKKEQKKIEDDPYYKAVNNLDSTIFLTDFENYALDNNDIKITEKKQKRWYYYQSNELYDKIKRKCYAIQRENDMGCGVTIYVDVTTGWIIAGRAFGD